MARENRRSGQERHRRASSSRLYHLRPGVVDFIELVTRREHLELQMEEVLITPSSPLAGRSILESGVRQKYGAIVVAVKQGNNHMQFNPAPEHRINAGDRLIILGPGKNWTRSRASPPRRLG